MENKLNIDCCGSRPISVNLKSTDLLSMYFGVCDLLSDISNNTNIKFSKEFIDSIEWKICVEDLFNDLSQIVESSKCISEYLKFQKDNILPDIFEYIEVEQDLSKYFELEALHTEAYKRLILDPNESFVFDTSISSIILAYSILHAIDLSKSNDDEVDDEGLDFWVPPDNFKYGTEDEKEIWENYNKD